MESPSRYLIGLDLGTTNSAVAYIDIREGVNDADSSGIKVFDVAQLAGAGEVRALPLLPSFLYFPTEDEISSGAVALPWDERPSSIAGAMARDQGALVPSRQVASAKSWLCQSAIDRTADILPREAEPPEPKVSPVEASARYLVHLRNSWNGAMAGDGDPQQLFENQEIVLTVPASFDEEARELTVEAARQAGLKNLTLLEEPLAAFYAWMAKHRNGLSGQLRDGECVLICDVGGGTSDFSLVVAHVAGEDVEFERTAIGEHLLLGGENLDLALARRVEQKLNTKLSLRQRHALRVVCTAAKERLLGDDNIDSLPINILGGGRSVVGQMLSSELSRGEVVELLTSGFLPLTTPEETPARTRVAGLREIGLPYVADPAITKHLAAFLKQAALADAQPKAQPNINGGVAMARPDAVLFNGGFCIPAIARERITEAISHWFDGHGEWRPRILNNEAMSSAVAIGAAYYGRVRRGIGLRVKAGSARTYYIGMRSEQGIKAVCVLPSGTNEGTTLPLLDREFSVLANRPVSFHLYSSRTRHDPHGAIVDLHPDEVHRHAPLVTLLRYGKKLQQMELAVRLSVSFTEVGTLELWCESVSSPHRWRLQFELRREASATEQSEHPSRASHATRHRASCVSEQSQESALRLLERAFAKPGTGDGDTGDPASLVGELESVIGLKRESWPIAMLRIFCDVLLNVADGCKLSPRHEVRWLNLFGYCLRPGFGDPQDGQRITQARRIYQAGLAFPRELQSHVDWLVLWRRIAAGLSAAHQHELRNYLGGLGIGRKKPGTRLNSQVEHDGWRLLASLEHLSGATRAALGSELLRKLKKEPADSGWLWSLGRFGARIPLYGSLTCVVPAPTAAEWIAALVDLRELTHETASAIVQLGRRVDDPARDISPDVLRSAIAALKPAGVADDTFLRPMYEYVAPARADVLRTFGEPLPKGLELESTANCLSPVTALAS